MDAKVSRLATCGVFMFCVGYFLSYIPYTMMTKMITSGLFEGMNGTGFTGFQIAPISALGSFVAMYIFITAVGWWKFATHSKVFGISMPRPQWFTFISGLCTAGVIVTTTLAYTFSGISIVFAMLLMRGGVLIMAPMVDLIVKKRKRKIYWPSWVASILSVTALLLAFSEKAGSKMTLIASIDIGIYLFSYFFRLFIMSHRAKSDDVEERKRYFTEEQMVANPILFITLFVIAWMGRGGGVESLSAQLWSGFVFIPVSGYFLATFLIGVFSYGTGLFGSLIFLDKRENTFTVPANRAASVLAGVVSSYLLGIYYTNKYPSAYELAGASLIIVAIGFLMCRTITEKKKKRAFKTQTVPVKKNVNVVEQLAT